MTDLGREIPITDGRKPEWLADDEVIAPTYRVGRFDSIEAGKATSLAIIATRLRADHPFYKQEAAIGHEASGWVAGGNASVYEKAPSPSFDTDKYVLVERMTRGEVVARFSGWTHTQVCEVLGIIRPEATPLERYMEQYPGDDRDIVERVLAWKEGL